MTELWGYYEDVSEMYVFLDNKGVAVRKLYSMSYGSVIEHVREVKAAFDFQKG